MKPEATKVLNGKVAMITGGGSGLGRAIVERYVSDGANVGVLERMPQKVDSLREQFGDRIVVTQGDVRSLADNDECVSQTVTRFGGLDVLVGVQGIWDGNTHLMSLPSDGIDAAFDEVFAVNVKGYLLSARAAVPQLLETSGTIILTLSNAAFNTDGGGVLYVSSKHAAVGLVRQLAFELAPRIRVNGIAPANIMGSDLRGPTSLNLGERSYGRPAPDPTAAAAETLFPLPFLPEAGDYGGLYSLLASDDSRVMTGTVIQADQGLSVRGFRRAAGGNDLYSPS